MSDDRNLKHRSNWEAATDADLLLQFVSNRDEAAFRQLVERHRGLVMGVCRSILGSSHDADDAFQATFLILARRAGSIRRLSSFAGWLQRVAYRTALGVAKRKAQRRELLLDCDVELSQTDFDAIHRQELARTVHEELRAIPERLRNALILCHFEGFSRRHAAEMLECTESALKARLARGRKMLRMRLIRRGIALSVGLYTITSAGEQAMAATSHGLTSRTVELVTGYISAPEGTGFSNSTSINIANTGVRNMILRSFVAPSSLAIVLALLGGVFALRPAPAQTGDLVSKFSPVVTAAKSSLEEQLPPATALVLESAVAAQQMPRSSDRSLQRQQEVLRLQLSAAEKRLEAAKLKVQMLQANDASVAETARKKSAVMETEAVVLDLRGDVLRLASELEQEKSHLLQLRLSAAEKRLLAAESEAQMLEATETSAKKLLRGKVRVLRAEAIAIEREADVLNSMRNLEELLQPARDDNQTLGPTQ